MADAAPTTPRQILIDTDPGIDDAMALLFLRAISSIRIAAITTVFGNSEVATTTRNACYLAERFGINAPVFAGADRPLRAERLASPVHVHGRNGLGDVPIPERMIRRPAAGQAHERMVELIRPSCWPADTAAAAATNTATIAAACVRRIATF